MNNIISFSGGRTSAYLCYLIKNSTQFENSEFVYLDTGLEHPKTYDFIRRVNLEFSLNLTCLQVVVNDELGKANSFKALKPDELRWNPDVFKPVLKKYGEPSLFKPHCSRVLKTEVAQRYATFKHGKNGYLMWLGIRADEHRRLVEKPNIRYLAEISDFDKSDILAFWRSQGFDLEIPEHLGNCVFCVKKNERKLAMSIKEEPGLTQDFKNLLAFEETRVFDPRLKGKIYRGYKSFDDLILLSKETNNLKPGNDLDESACSASCEA